MDFFQTTIKKRKNAQSLLGLKVSTDIYNEEVSFTKKVMKHHSFFSVTGSHRVGKNPISTSQAASSSQRISFLSTLFHQEKQFNMGAAGCHLAQLAADIEKKCTENGPVISQAHISSLILEQCFDYLGLHG